jgi:hypothetical protein
MVKDEPLLSGDDVARGDVGTTTDLRNICVLCLGVFMARVAAKACADRRTTKPVVFNVVHAAVK